MPLAVRLARPTPAGCRRGADLMAVQFFNSLTESRLINESEFDSVRDRRRCLDTRGAQEVDSVRGFASGSVQHAARIYGEQAAGGAELPGAGCQTAGKKRAGVSA